MPNYIPIQDLTGKSSISDNDYVPVSDGTTAYGVRASLFKSYSTTEAEAAAAAAAASAASLADFRENTYRDLTEVTVSLTPSYYIGGVAAGEKWTDYLSSNNSYSYVAGGIDCSAYNSYDGYLIISAPLFESNSARLGFAESDGTVTWVTTGSQTYGFARYNSDTEKYDMFIKVVGDSFFYSNKKTNINYATFKLVRIPFAENSFFSAGSDTYQPDKYVATTGNDNNAGTAAYPYATVARAIADNPRRIFIAPGTYSEKVQINDVDVEIIGMGRGAVFNGISGDAFWFENSHVIMRNISVTNISAGSGSGFRLKNCKGTLEDCRVDNTPNMGFRFTGSQFTVIRCYAANCAVDGFNGHDYTDNNITYVCDCTFIDCVADSCGDDGLSFHENGHFTVYGGEFMRCTSTGIAPHNYCQAEIYNAYIHNNGGTSHSGLEAFNPPDTYVVGSTKARVMTFGNLLTNNGKYGIDVMNDVLISVGDRFAGNGTGTVNTAGSGAEVTVYA